MLSVLMTAHKEIHNRIMQRGLYGHRGTRLFEISQQLRDLILKSIMEKEG